MLKESYISLQSLLLGFGVVSYFIFGCNDSFYPIFEWLRHHVIVYCIVFYLIINIIIFIVYRGDDWQVAVRACFIGMAFGIGTILSVLCPASDKPFGWYLIVLGFFHFSEYLTTSITNPPTLSLDSFLLNHSVAYWAAAVCSWLEFFLERWLLPSLKECWYVSLIGIMICIFGEIMRKSAMITARTNFNHIVQVEKQKDHELVTWGVYRCSRHPSYLGWFWWSIGTQVILVNPVCIVAYAVTSWLFFRDRIQFEEMTLIKFFGQRYLDYKKRVGTGLPFIGGYKTEERVYEDQ